MGGVLLEVLLQVGAASSWNVPRVQHLNHDVRAVQHLACAPSPESRREKEKEEEEGRNHKTREKKAEGLIIKKARKYVPGIHKKNKGKKGM